MSLPSLTAPPTLAEIRDCHAAIQPFIHRTPVLTCRALDERAGARLYFKCENFQRIGAFKMRGGASAALSLTPAERARGLATHSSGNHAQAVAAAARELGVPAYIVMPEDAPAVKIAAVRDYGAEVTFCVNTPADRERTLRQVTDRSGAAFIHPFDDYNVIRGQATAALELVEDCPVTLDVLMTPVGGGGLTAGTALVRHYLLPGGQTIGAEPKNVDDAARSMQSGRVETNQDNRTVADGLRTNLSERTLGIIREHVAEILTVSEEEIVAAMRLIWERMKIVIEPSCAVPLAAVLAYPDRFAGKNVGIILTGGNVDLARLPFRT
ncbi:MAG: pyridoxal-phosphate dependent enzyme [Saprospiraceae bacterium]